MKLEVCLLEVVLQISYDYITIAATGNAVNFGDLTHSLITT